MNTRVYIADVSTLSHKATFDRLYSFVPEYRRQKIDRIKNEAGKCLSLGVGLLLKGACEDFGIVGADEHILYTESGKPYFEKYSKILFSLSHSYERAMCVMSTYEVGCDVEKVRGNKLKLAERFYTPEEFEWIKGLEGEDAQNEGFYRIWTLKESYMKLTGLGFVLSPEKFGFRMDGDRIVLDHEGAKPEVLFRELDCQDGYKYACCLKNAPVDCIIDVEKRLYR